MWVIRFWPGIAGLANPVGLRGLDSRLSLSVVGDPEGDEKQGYGKGASSSSTRAGFTASLVALVSCPIGRLVGLNN